jgi:hypothetical protein
MKPLRRILALLLGAAVLLPLSACIPAEPSGQDPPPSPDAPPGPSPSAAAGPSPSPEITERMPITGSFIQGWLVRNWDKDRWLEEFEAMKASGLDLIILQTTVDKSFDRDTDLGLDSRLYPLNYIHALYPSQLPELTGHIGGSNDSLRGCLEAARETGISVMIGLVDDTRWWRYGWALPAAVPEFGSDPAMDSYWGRWAVEHAHMTNKAASEIWEIYGEEFGDVIYGWYYVSEWWNFEPFNQDAAKILAESLNIILDHLSVLTPGMPLGMSPFHNLTMKGPADIRQQYLDIFALTRWRPYDILAPQDSIGANQTNGLPTLHTWLQAYKDAADAAGIRFWVNNENFTRDYTAAGMSRFAVQMQVSAPLAERLICFSWNHYFSPTNTGTTRYNDAYLRYIETGLID